MMVNYLKSEIMLCCLFLAGIAAAKPIQPPAKENPMLAEAQYKYGVYCKKTLKDEKKAFQYLELAAKQNYRQAWVYLAECYLAKNNVHPSYFLWAKLCLQAAERLKADAETEYRIGLIEALTGNLPEFKHWMKLAADKGHKNAASLLNDSRIHKKIISFRQKQERKQQRNALKNSINAHFKKLQQTLGDDADEMIEQLSLQRPVSTISKMIRLPHPQDIILPGWNYDPAQTEALIEKNLMADREGGTRWMTEEFFKQPLWENLLYPNPTIRAINATHEEELIGSLNKSPFRRCKKEEIKSLIKPFMDSEAPKDYYDDDAVWDLGNNLYFRLHVASDGAWKLPDYQFFVVRNGKSIHVETFPHPPSVADAALVAGIVKNNPACWNNLAVKYADGEMDQVFRRDDDAEGILKNLVKSRHAIGTYNLAIFYQNRKKNAEAKKYFALAETFAGNSVISPLVNSPEIFDRNGTLLVKNRLFRTHKENIRIYTKGGCFAAPLIGLIQTYSNPQRTRAEYDRTGVEEIIYRQNPGLAAFLTLDCALQSKLEKLMTDIAVKSDPLYAYGIIVNSSGELIAAAQSSVFDAE
ncbi:MAG: sel1 repeat family protein, partial [Lentisphaeria bacterium]|nr:sel1 repeat family protein [Lentisphaeria bacterium]